MKLLVKKLITIIGKITGTTPEFELEHRFFNAIGIVAVISAFVMVIFNVSLGFGIELILAVALTTLIFLFLYWLSRVKRMLALSKWLLTVLVFLIISYFWFKNGGSKGALLHAYLVFFLLILFVWEGPYRLLFILLFAINITAFFIIESYYPEMITGYENEKTRILDIYTAYVVYSFLGAFILLYMLNSYIREKKKAEESDQLKSAFLANMSHEIRTPMNSILGFSQLLNEDITDQEKQTYSRIIRDNSKSLLRLMDDIIEISKIEAGQIEINLGEWNIHEVFEDLKTNSKQMLSEQDKTHIEISYFTSQNDLILITDLTQFKLIFTNLLTNAVKYTEEGSIRFGYTVNKRFIHFYVRDTGTGIKPENHEKIFERFIKLDEDQTNQTKLYGGTGIGLSISKSLVELLGGKIWVKSEYGHGSTFYFTLPNEQVTKGRSRKAGSRKKPPNILYLF